MQAHHIPVSYRTDAYFARPRDKAKTVGDWLAAKHKRLRLIEADRIFGSDDPHQACHELAIFLHENETRIVRDVWTGLKYQSYRTQGYLTLGCVGLHVELLSSRPCNREPVIERMEERIFPGAVDAAAYYGEPVAYVRRQMSGYKVNRWFDGTYRFEKIRDKDREAYYEC